MAVRAFHTAQTATQSGTLLECGGAPPLFFRRPSSNRERTAALAIFPKRQNTAALQDASAQTSRGKIFAREPKRSRHPDELTTALDPPPALFLAKAEAKPF